MMSQQFPSSITCRSLLAAAVLSIVSPSAFGQSRCGGDCDTCRSCVIQDDGSGTVVAPTFNCEYTGGRFILRTGLPAGSTIECTYSMCCFFDICPPQPGCDVVVIGPPPPAGWSAQSANGSMVLSMQGTGALSNFARTITLPMQFVAFIGPHTPGDPVQSIDTEISTLNAALPAGIGDPDFDLLAMRIGCGNQLRSPGHTTLTKLPGGNWAVDSFFDVFYEIEFIGHPGGPLDGMSGITTGEPPVHAVSGGATQPVTPSNAVGSADVPSPMMPMTPPGGETMDIINGLPPGTNFQLKPKINSFSPASIVAGSIGGPGYQSPVEMTLDGIGTGALAGHERHLVLQGMIECHVGPIDPLADQQSLDNLTHMLQAQLPPGDRDFDLLRITAGNAFGLRSPGHTTLTRMPATVPRHHWWIDSFFDIDYRIDFVGNPIGPFAGMSGSTTGTIRMTQGGRIPQFQLNAFGLTHMVTGAAQMDGVLADPPDPDSWMLQVSNIGSSGQDGVSIQLADPPDPDNSELVGFHKWFGEVEAGPIGFLAPGTQVHVEMHASNGFTFPSMHLEEANGGAAAVRLNGLPPGTRYIGNLYREGQLVLTQDFPPPAPGLSPIMVSGNIGSSGNDGVQFLIGGRKADDDTIDFTLMVVNTQIVPMSLGGLPPVDADACVVRLNGLPPGTRYIGNRVSVTAANTLGGLLDLKHEGIIHRDVAVRKLGTVNGGVEPAGHGSSMVAIGDLDGDGRPDFAIDNLGSSGQDGVQFFDPGSEPFRYPWRLIGPPLAGRGAEVRVIDTPDGSLPPNAHIEARYKFEGGNTPIIKGSALRCTSGTCDEIEIHVDFSELGATTMSCAVLNGNVVVGTVNGLEGTVVCSAPASASLVRLDGTRSTDDGVIKTFTWTQVGGPFKFTTSSGKLIMLVGDTLRVTPDDPQVIPTEMLSMQLVGSNMCRLAILDVETVPLPQPPPCPADLAPPGGNGSVGVPDLLFIINNWGPCILGLPCLADIAPPGGNGTVGVPDLLRVINSWGPCL